MLRQAAAIAPLSVAVALLSLSLACQQSDFGDPIDTGPVSDSPGVGDDQWSEREITCQDESDCGDSEACIEGVCQVSPCGEEAYESTAPLGHNLEFLGDREVVVADSSPEEGGYWVDGYRATESALGASEWESWNTGSREVVDVAGGDLAGGDREYVAIAEEGATEIRVERGGATEALNVGFEPVALAAGDVDGDGVEDIVVLGEDGLYGLCKVPEGMCTNSALDGEPRGIDAAAGDIDGDGFAEGVFLVERGGDRELVAWNPHYQETGEDEFWSTTPSLGHRDSDFRRVAAGDVSGDGIAEVMAIHSRHLTYNDRVKIFRAEAGTFDRVGNVNLHTQSSRDVAVGDLNRSGDHELVVLRGGGAVDVYRGDGSPGSISFLFDAPLSDTSSAARLTTADLEGNTPRARRVAGPEKVAGPVVPLIASNFPPYDSTHADGLPSVMVGDTETTTETFTDSVSMSAGVQVGAEIDLFGALGGGAQSAIDRSISRAESNTNSFTVGNRFVFQPDKEDFGSRYGVVIVSAGCFHHYTYEVSDPSGELAASAHGEEIVGVVPVDGQSTVWTTHRYNALAEHVDYLPPIEFGTEIGDLDTYPNRPARADGSPIPDEDLVFEDTPQYLASEAARVGWWLSHQETEAQQESMSTTVSAVTSISAGASVQTNVSATIGSSYQIAIGEQYLFGGNIPPIDVDSSAPRDDYEERAYGFGPYVYRETYEDPDGGEAGFYVLDFTAGE